MDYDAVFRSMRILPVLLALLPGTALAQPLEPIPALPPPPFYPEPTEPPAAQPGDGQPMYFVPDEAEPRTAYVKPAYSVPSSQASYRGRLPFRSQFGLGIRGSGLWVATEALNEGQGGIGLELLFRAHRRVSLELSAQYQYSRTAVSYDASYARTDVPILLGLRIHVGPKSWSVLSPYVVAALGADYARVVLSGAPDAAWFAELQLGGGLEYRFGRHFALNVDIRGFNRLHPEGDLAQYVSNEYGNFVPALRNQYGLLFNVGLAAYF